MVNNIDWAVKLTTQIDDDFVKPLKCQAKLKQTTLKFFIHFSEKTCLHISCESSAKKIKKKMSSAAVVIVALRVNCQFYRGMVTVCFVYLFIAHTSIA